MPAAFRSNVVGEEENSEHMRAAQVVGDRYQRERAAGPEYELCTAETVLTRRLEFKTEKENPPAGNSCTHITQSASDISTGDKKRAPK